MAESDIQIAIVEILSLYASKNNFLFFSVPNEALLFGAANDRGKAFGKIKKLKKMGLTPGVSDLIIGKDSKTYCLEIKDGNKKLSYNQSIFKNLAICNGWKYKKIDSIDEAIQILKKWNIIDG